MNEIRIFKSEEFGEIRTVEIVCLLISERQQSS